MTLVPPSKAKAMWSLKMRDLGDRRVDGNKQCLSKGANLTDKEQTLHSPALSCIQKFNMKILRNITTL